MNQFSLRAGPGWPPVVVGGAYYTAINLMRNLARRGLKTYCFDYGQNRQAFHTVYGKAFKCPDPDRNPSDWLEFMLNLARKIGGKPVLIPSADIFVLAMEAHADVLEKAYIFCRETIALQGLLATKKRQYDLAIEHGMPIPRTRFATNLEEVLEFGSAIEYPCVIKPVRSYDWAKIQRSYVWARSKVALAASSKELEEKYRIIAGISHEVVVQEVIAGPDTSRLVYLSCYSIDHRRIARCMVRTIRSSPINFGSSSVVEPVEDPDTDSFCDRFLKSIGYAGLCEISLKRDSRDGLVKMIETNPRYTGISNAAPYAGVDLGWLHYLDLIGRRVEMVNPNGRKFRHIALTWDAKTIGSCRRAGLLTWRDLIRSYRPPVVFYDLDLRDWRVGARTLFTLLYLIFGRPIRRLFSKNYQY
jgi:D-aspartate ligase